uniref:hypothetical protein n=2 Tax=Flavobacterium sp. TaxID=239 RepID=UPI00404B816F
MIQTDKIDNIHSIKSKTPDTLIKLPLSENVTFNYDNVTCFMINEDNGMPGNYRCIGIEFYENFSQESIFNDRFNGYVLSYIYVYKGNPFEIEELKKEVWFRP